MPKPSLPTQLSVLALLACCSSPGLSKDKKTQSPCDKPREFLSKQQLTKEEQKKARQAKAQGMVAISISEEGDVVDAKVVQASSPEAVEFLLEQARSMKFKPRAGCGVTHTEVNFTLQGS